MEARKEHSFFSHMTIINHLNISDQELTVIRKHLIPYFLHISEDETVISPIYGIQKLFRQNVNESINVVVTRNSIQIPSIYRVRTYDIKGSEHSRQVLKKSITANEDQLKKITLKDIDFQNLEQQLHIPQQFKERLRK